MNKPLAISGASIGFDESALEDHTVLVDNGNIIDVLPTNRVPQNTHQLVLNGGTLLPGFIDLQVNGGGGVLFNHNPCIETIETICSAHTKLGTCRLLVTLISSDDATTNAAISAAIEAEEKGIPGFLGLHLEGPHLSVARRGAHSEHHIRAMSQADVDTLCRAKARLSYFMITVAPESVSPEQIEQLSSAGIVVSLGHSNASFEQAKKAFARGARCATHLYNAMSPLGHREPGMVGAVLTQHDAYAGLIADGVHVHKAAIKTALAMKSGPGKLFAVSDAMATTGSDIKEFELDGRTISRKNARLELSDGTLAGADTDLYSSFNYLVEKVGVDRSEAIRMVSSYPSACVGAMDYLGSLIPGHAANLIYIDQEARLMQVWVDGQAQLTE